MVNTFASEGKVVLGNASVQLPPPVLADGITSEVTSTLAKRTWGSSPAYSWLSISTSPLARNTNAKP